MAKKKIDFQSRGVIKIYETQQRKHEHTARGKVTDSRRDLNTSLMMFKSVTFRYYLLANIAERLKAFTSYWSTRPFVGKMKSCMYNLRLNDNSIK